MKKSLELTTLLDASLALTNKSSYKKMRTLHLRKKDATETNKRYTWQLTRNKDTKVRNYKVTKAFLTYPPTESTAVTSAEISALGAQAWMTGTDAGLFDSLSTQSVHIEVTETGGLSETNIIQPD